MKVKIDGNGRIVIPHLMRKALGVDIYSELEICVIDNKIILNNPKENIEKVKNV